MPTTYLVTGVSRGIGFGFLRVLSSNPENLVIGLVRDKDATEKKISAELGSLPNVHVVQADLVRLEELKRTVETVSAITGGSLDYIVANAALIAPWSGNLPITVVAESPERLEEEFLESFRVNVIGQANLFNAYLPLLLKGKEKKVIALSSAMGDLTMIRELPIKLALPYTVSKAGLNALIAKYHAQYSDQGALFLAICPGFVETGHQDDLSPEQMQYVTEMVTGFFKYAPHARKRSPEEAVEDILSVAKKSSLEGGHGGLFLSHLGSTTQWL